MWQAQNVTPLPPPPPLRTPRASDCEIAYNTCSGRLPINQSLLQGHLWSYSQVEALNKDILLNPETGLKFVIVTNPVTLERFVVLNNPSCDVSMFLNLYTRIFIWRWECGSVEVRSRNSLGTFEEHGHRVWQKYIKSDYRITPHANS